MKYKNHIWVWEKHHGKIPKNYQIHHKDGNKRNNSIENLELLTAEEHRKKHPNYYKKGNKPWNKNKKGVQRHSEETKRKISETHKRKGLKPPSRTGKNHSEKTKKKISKSNKGRKHTEEFKEMRRERQKKLWKNPEYRKRMIEAHKKPNRNTL